MDPVHCPLATLKEGTGSCWVRWVSLAHSRRCTGLIREGDPSCAAWACGSERHLATWVKESGWVPWVNLDESRAGVPAWAFPSCFLGSDRAHLNRDSHPCRSCASMGTQSSSFRALGYLDRSRNSPRCSLIAGSFELATILGQNETLLDYPTLCYS